MFSFRPEDKIHYENMPIKYIENFTKNENFQIKNSDNFVNISAQNIVCGTR